MDFSDGRTSWDDKRIECFWGMSPLPLLYMQYAHSASFKLITFELWIAQCKYSELYSISKKWKNVVKRIIFRFVGIQFCFTFVSINLLMCAVHTKSKQLRDYADWSESLNMNSFFFIAVIIRANVYIARTYGKRMKIINSIPAKCNVCVWVFTEKPNTIHVIEFHSANEYNGTCANVTSSSTIFWFEFDFNFARVQKYCSPGWCFEVVFSLTLVYSKRAISSF